MIRAIRFSAFEQIICQAVNAGCLEYLPSPPDLILCYTSQGMMANTQAFTQSYPGIPLSFVLRQPSGYRDLQRSSQNFLAIVEFKLSNL